jgi:hypothetical protein
VKGIPAIELVTFGDEALLVNLDTGTYFAVNATAAEICRQLAAGADAGEIVSGLIERHNLPALAAHRAVAGVVDVLNDPAPAAEPVGELRYRPTAWGYALHLADRPVLETRRDGSALRLVGTRSESPEVVEGWIRCLLAKSLSLQGQPVLHASACVFGDRVVAICGPSGAGKTSTARALAKAGRTMIAEDMVILAREDGAQMHVAGEPSLRRWAAAAVPALAAAPDRTIDCAGLSALVRTPERRPLGALLFLDRTRRRGDSFITDPLRPLETLAELLQSSFLGSSDPPAWRAFVADNASVASAVPGARLTVPQGLERLTAAAARFDYKVSSRS